MSAGVKLAVTLLVLVLASCSHAAPSSPEPDPSWLAMVPGDAIAFDGPGGELLMIYVDETYSIGDVNASALTWRLGDRYRTDYFVEDDDGALWWYGRRGGWRAGRRGEEPRRLEIVDHRVRFGDVVLTLSEDREPVQIELPDGVYTPAAAAAPAPEDDGVTRLLFLGNSHTARHDVPGTVERLLRGLEPGSDIVAVLGPGSMHLDERGEDAETLESVAAQPWDFVVLQAQNYSLSGCCDYPTTGAETLVRLAREQDAVPVLYAEWARRGIDETDLIIETYQRITDRQPACLPPVPEAFDLALRRFPGVVLHAEDGNHASAAGAYLASAVLASAISGRPVSDLRDLDAVGVPAAVQAEAAGGRRRRDGGAASERGLC